MMNIETAFKKPFSDIKKLIIGILLSIVPIVRFFASGYILECSGIGKKKSSNKMPEWKNFEYYFVKGFFSFVISFLYLIPAIILLLLGVGTLAFSFISAYLGETTWYDLGSLGADESEAVTALASQDFSLIMPMILKMAPVIILGVLLAILATYVLPIAILDYIKTGKLKAAFNWKAVFRRAFTGKYFIVWIVVSLIGIVAAMLLRIIPILGKAAASFITGVIGYTLFGEVYKKLK